MARPVFKTAMKRPLVASVGSIPTRSRHRPLWWLVAALIGTVSISAAAQAAKPAQPLKPAKPAPVAVATPDTLSPLARPIKPMVAFAMSLAVPGWGQARLDRKLTGAIFVSLEGASLGMTMKTAHEIGYLTRVAADTARLTAKRRQRQDWLIFLGFNHLFAGVEAFVATHLHEFPRDVGFRVMPAPGGGVLAVTSVPFRIR